MEPVLSKPKVRHPRQDISFIDELQLRRDALYPLKLHGYEVDYIISLIHNDTVTCTEDWSKWRSTASPAVEELENYLSGAEIPKRKREMAKHRRKHKR